MLTAVRMDIRREMDAAKELLVIVMKDQITIARLETENKMLREHLVSRGKEAP